MRARLAGGWLLASLASAAPSFAQSLDAEFDSTEQLHLDHIEAAPGERRAIEVYLRPVGKSLGPIDLLTKKSIALTQDGKAIEEFDLEQLSDSSRGTAAVYAIDVSRTMRGESFDRAKSALVELLDKQATFDRVAIVAFGGQVLVVAPFSAERAEARSSLDALAIDEDALHTVLYEGIQKAVDLLREETDLPRRQYVVVISDAAGASGTELIGDVVERANGEEGEPRIPISVIGRARYDPKDLDLLRKLAKDTGGYFFDAGELGRIPVHLKTIASQNGRSYVLTYAASLDGGRHELEARVEGRSDKRAAPFPERGGLSVWWFVGGAALVLVIGGLAFWLFLRRGVGRLVFVSGGRSGDAIALRQGVIQIGGIEDNDVVIPNERVSRYHARVLVDGRRVEIEDLGSTNGTAVNGERVERCRLRAGDRIVLAQEVELEYQR